MININDIVQKGRNIFRLKLFNEFISNKEHFRLIISIDERKTYSSDKILGIQHQLWQSIDDPWIFIIFIDFTRLIDSIDFYFANETNEIQLDNNPKPEIIENKLKEIQKENFQFIIEGDPLIFDSSTQMSPALVDIDFFNNFYDFKQIIPLSTGVFTNNSMFYFRGVEQEKEKVPRLLFYALHHPDQFIKESVGEAFEKLYQI